MEIQEINRKYQELGLTPLCPFCAGKHRGHLSSEAIMWLDKNPAMNPLSRRDGTKICKACAKAEFLVDYMGFLDDTMARLVVEQERQEAMRLLPGTFYGVSKWPTGGLEDWLSEFNRRQEVIRSSLFI